MFDGEIPVKITKKTWNKHEKTQQNQEHTTEK